METYRITPEGELIRISDEPDPVALAAYCDRLNNGEAELPAIRERIDVLNDATDDGWCPLPGVSSPLENLDRGLSAWLISERRPYVDETLHNAETDLAAWRRMSLEEQAARVAEIERIEGERLARRDAEEKLRRRTAAFYAEMQRANVSPPRWLDNDIANWSLAV